VRAILQVWLSGGVIPATRDRRWKNTGHWYCKIWFGLESLGV